MTTDNLFASWAADLSVGDWISVRQALQAAVRSTNRLVAASVVLPDFADRVRADTDDVERDALLVNNWCGVMIARLDKAIECTPDYRPPVDRGRA